MSNDYASLLSWGGGGGGGGGGRKGGGGGGKGEEGEGEGEEGEGKGGGGRLWYEKALQKYQTRKSQNGQIFLLLPVPSLFPPPPSSPSLSSP